MVQTELDAKEIIKTIGLLKIRINERFSQSNLGHTCNNLLKIARDSDETVQDIQKTHFGYRVLVFFFVLATLSLSIYGVKQFKPTDHPLTMPEVVMILEAVLNILLLVGGAIVFLISMENRMRRRKVIQAVNTLRSLAHVIDAHQLTKDPCYLDQRGIKTSHSPERNMTPFLLSRYLDYCSEMLSLISKVGFLYIQHYHDLVATEAVNDLDDLTNGLSRKIWQKIMTIDDED